MLIPPENLEQEAWMHSLTSISMILQKDFVGGKISTVENSLLKRNGVLNNTATMGNFLNSHDEGLLFSTSL